MNADVIISGLGPTGLVLAHMLGMRGHKVVILEREPVFYGNARAVYTDDECMRIFQHIGLADALAADMLKETPVQWMKADGSVAGRYLPLDRPYGWPVVNFLYQPYLETRLADALARYPNVEIRRGRDLVGFTQDETGVTVTHEATRNFRFSDASDEKAERTGGADTQALRARYLVGADGGRSTVRTLLGIEMEGRNFPEPWLVVDLKHKVPGEGLRHLPYFNFVMDPKMPVVSCVQPDGYHRFEFMLMPGMTKEWMEDPATVRDLLSRWVDPDKFEIKRKLVYTFNALIAKSWRQGRVLLAGDAAHMTPQFMGQGANAGIRDAYNLGWKLGLVLDGVCDDALLDSYQRERHGHAKAMIDISVLMKSVVSMTHPVATGLRDLGFVLVNRIPSLKRWAERGEWKPKPVYRQGSYLGLARRRRKGPEGTLAPQADVRLPDGRHVRFDDLLGDGFALVGFNCDPMAALSAEARTILDRLGTRAVALYPYAGRPQDLRVTSRDYSGALGEAEDISGRMSDWFRKAGAGKEVVAILRPDRVVFSVTPQSDLEAAIIALANQLAQGAAALPRATG